jgi:hypothetical protein
VLGLVGASVSGCQSSVGASVNGCQSSVGASASECQFSVGASVTVNGRQWRVFSGCQS